MNINFSKEKKYEHYINIVFKEDIKNHHYRFIENNKIEFYLNPKDFSKNKNKNEIKEYYRNIGSNIFQLIKKEKITEVDINTNSEENILDFLEGLILTDYKFDKYLSKKDENNNENSEIKINTITNINYSNDLKKINLISNNVKIARDLVNENSHEIYPETFVNFTKDKLKDFKNIKIKVLDENDISKKGMKLIEAVGSGSDRKPRVLILEYFNNNRNKEEIYSLIGKGVTFDSGGYSLKPSNSMLDMRGDMAGAAAVLGTFKSIVELELKINLVVIIPLAENSVSGISYKPGDIYGSYSGKTVEIKNTDAEGRLILADAITLSQEYNPKLIIDIATLTGAIMAALGDKTIGLFGNEEEYKNTIFEAGENTAEYCWKMPIKKEHEEAIKGQLADLKNIGNKFGGACTAAAFLKQFINEDVKWIHLDIAGPALLEKDDGYKTQMGSGVGVRLLVNFLEELSEK